MPGAASTKLAMQGGAPVRRLPLPAWPWFAEDEVRALERVARSGRVNYWTGSEGREFEKEFAAWLAVKHAVALANGSVALELALAILGIGPGDEVVTTPRSFIASASSIVLRGARPVFCDVDRVSGNITAETIRAALTPGTRAILAVHLGGWPCAMGPIMDLAKERDLLVIEDCAQAHGATWQGRLVGSFGHVAAWSFCQDKILTTLGEGGMLTTNDESLWKRAWAYKDHGKSYDAVSAPRPDSEKGTGFRWLHESFGTNWRISEAHAAVGRLQLTKLPQWLEQRRRNAAMLIARLGRLKALRVPIPVGDANPAYYKFYAYLRPDRLKAGWYRDRIVEAIQAEGIPCFTGSCSEIYLEKAFPPEMCPTVPMAAARELGETSLMMLVHPTLGSSHMEQTCEAVEKVLAAATL
jgi:dTDP-4-amino-4,6-dideoxygalactose transaminase